MQCSCLHVDQMHRVQLFRQKIASGALQSLHMLYSWHLSLMLSTQVAHPA